MPAFCLGCLGCLKCFIPSFVPMLGSFVVSFFMVGFLLMTMYISDCDRKRLSLFDLPLPSGPANPSDRLGGGSRLLPPIPSQPSQLVKHGV